MKYENYIKRYDSWEMRENFAIIDTLKDGQVVKVYRTLEACKNNVWKMNDDYNYGEGYTKNNY